MKSRISAGGLRECLIRGLLYVGMARGAADERGLAAIRGLRAIQDDRSRLTLAEFKAVVREQYYMLLIDQEAALGAIPDLLPPDKDACRKAFAALLKVLSASGECLWRSRGQVAANRQVVRQRNQVGRSGRESRDCKGVLRVLAKPQHESQRGT